MLKTLVATDGKEGTPVASSTNPLQQLLGRYLVVTDRVSCGAQPTTDADFAALAKQEVSVIISVDGARPNLKLAEQHGLEYVHIPLGYDGIPRTSCLAISEVLTRFPGRVFIHCHHGKHRAPAAAAIAGIMAGQLTHVQARQVLVEAETGRQYIGLWRDVQKAYPARADEVVPDLVSVAEVEDIVRVMSRVSRNFDFLVANSPQTQDSQQETLHRLLLLEEDFRELARNFPDGKAGGAGDSKMRVLLQQFSDEASQLREQASAWHEQASFPEDAQLQWRAKLTGLKQSCTSCHKAFRNGN